MSQGDNRVEKYMPAIDKAIREAGVTGQAATNIYNRAYEAIMAAINAESKYQQNIRTPNGSGWSR